MMRMTATTKRAEPEVPPLATDPRVEQAEARLAALQQRHQAVRSRSGHIVSDDYVARLMADPTAVLEPEADLARTEAEAQALKRAIEAAEADVTRVRDAAGHAHVLALRPPRSASAAELVSLLERAAEVMGDEIELNRRLVAAGYASATPFAYVDDRAAVLRFVQRTRRSGLFGGLTNA